jgi:hypothetical protein
VVELSRCRVAVLSAEDRFSRVTSVFEPPSSPSDGGERPDSIMSVCWGAAPGEGGGGGSDGGGSGAVGERLLVACRSSCIWLLDA